jgi:hypothetical protein
VLAVKTEINFKMSEPRKSPYSQFQEGQNYIMAYLLDRASLMERAKQISLARVAASAPEMEGDVDSPAHREAACIALRKILHSEMVSASQRLLIRIPDRDDDCSIVHGRIIDSTGAGIPGQTVAVIGEKKVRLQSETTDELGYFKLTIRCDRSHEVAIDTPRERTGRGPVPKIGREQHSGERQSKNRMILELGDQDGRVLYQDLHPMLVGRGEIVYRELIKMASNVGQTRERQMD